jgi:hypothetical protein
MNVRKDEPLDGSYQAVVKSLEKKETKYGERLMWLFSVPEYNAEVAGFTSLSESVLANAYLWAKALLGEIDPEKGWSSEDVVGKRCTLVVEAYEDGSGRKKNRVVLVKPPKGAGTA